MHWGCGMTSQGSNHLAEARHQPFCSCLSHLCFVKRLLDEKLKNNAIMPNSIEQNNLFLLLPTFCLSHSNLFWKS